MSEDLTVLLLGAPDPADQLKALLERHRIFGDRTRLDQLDSMVALVQPVLIVQFGKDGIEQTLDILKNRSATSPTRLVVIAPRADLPALRGLDRDILVGHLAADMPESVLAARIAAIARQRTTPSVVPPPSSDPASEKPLPDDQPGQVRPRKATQHATTTPAPANLASQLEDSVPSSDSEGSLRVLNETTVQVSVAETMALQAQTSRHKDKPHPETVDASSSKPATITRPMQPPETPRVLVADVDMMRGDAITRNLRQAGIMTMLVPMDPAKTRWPLVRQFGPTLLLVDKRDLESHGQVWHQLLSADQELSGAQLAALDFDRVFDETTGEVELSVLSPFLPAAASADRRPPLDSMVGEPAEVTDLDPSLIEEVPVSDRPTLFTQSLKERQSQSVVEAPAPEAPGPPSLSAEPPRTVEPRVAPVVPPQVPAGSDEVEFPKKGRTTRRILLSVVALSALAAGGAYAAKHWTDPTKDVEKAAKPAPVKVVDGDAHAPPPAPEKDPFSPWIVPPAPDIKTCEEIVDNLDQLKKLGLGQATVSFAEARKALVMGEMAEAHRHLCESSLIHPEGVGVEGLVEYLLSQHAPKRAQVWMDKAVKARPERRKTVELEADVLSQLGKVDQAKEIWATALNVQAGDDKGLHNLSTYYEGEGKVFLKTENWPKAELMYRRAVTLGPDNAEAIAGLAQSFWGQGFKEHAKYWADRAVELNPNLGPALLIQGELALEAGNEGQALSLFQWALKNDPGNSRAHQQLARLKNKDKQSEAQ